VVKSTFNTADLMHSPVEKTLKMLEKILKGERLFTMNNETPSVPGESVSQRGANPAGSIHRIIDNTNR
jgi:hypothetical protein